jgi:WD40 repeat protein
MLFASFSPDGRRVVTAGDAAGRVWDAATGQPITPPLVHGGRVPRASFSPDGRRVITACTDGQTRIWDAVSGELAMPPLEHTRAVDHASFSADGKRVLTVCEGPDGAHGSGRRRRVSHKRHR